MARMRTLRRALAALAIVVLIPLVVLGSLPWLLRIEPVHARVLDEVQRRSGMRVNFSTMSLWLFPIRVVLHNLHVQSTVGPSRLFVVDRAEVVFDGTDMLRGRVRANDIRLVHPHATIGPGDSPPPTTTQPAAEPTRDLAGLLTLPDLHIDDGEIILGDPADPDQGMRLTHVDITTARADNDDIALSGRGELQASSWRVPLQVSGTLHVHDPTLKLTLDAEPEGHGQLTARGRFDLIRYTFETRVRTDGFIVGQISAFGAQADPGGRLDIDLTVRGRESEWRNWSATGHVTLTDARILSPLVPDPIRIARVDMRLTGTSGTLTANMAVGQEPVLIDGRIAHWHKDPAVRIGVDAGELNVGEIVEHAETQKQTDPPDTDAPAAEPGAAAPEPVVPLTEVTLVTKRLVYRDIALSDLSARLAAQKTGVYLHRLSGDTERGHLEADGRFNWRTREWRIEWALSGVRVETLTRTFGGSDGELTGWLSTAGGLQGYLGGEMHSLCELEALIEEGRIRKLYGIAEILTLLNLPSAVANRVNLFKQGLPFDRIKLLASIEGGTVQIRKALLDGPVLKVSAAGRYDLRAEQINTTVAVSPLGSYTKLLRDLPMFGALLKGERQDLGTVYFEVKGAPTSPSVRFLPLKSLESGVSAAVSLTTDVLKNGLRLPKELLSLGRARQTQTEATKLDHC